MRTLASDVIVGGGEWSTPPVNVTLPAQPTEVTDNALNITSFTYRYIILYMYVTLNIIWHSLMYVKYIPATS